MSKPTLPVFVPPTPPLLPGNRTRPVAQGAEAAQTATGATFAELLESAAVRAVAPMEGTPSLSPTGEEKSRAEATPTKPRREGAPGASPLAEAVSLAAPLPLPLSVLPTPLMPPAAIPGDIAQQEEAAASPQGLPATRDPLPPPVGMAQVTPSVAQPLVQREEGQFPLPAASAPNTVLPPQPSPLVGEGVATPQSAPTKGEGAPSWEPDTENTVAAESQSSVVRRPSLPLRVAQGQGGLSIVHPPPEPETVQGTGAAGSPGLPEPLPEAIPAQRSASGAEQARSPVTLIPNASEGKMASEGGDHPPVAFVPNSRPAPDPVAETSGGETVATPRPAQVGNPEPTIDSPAPGFSPVWSVPRPPSDPGQTETSQAVPDPAITPCWTNGAGGAALEAQASSQPLSPAVASDAALPHPVSPSLGAGGREGPAPAASAPGFNLTGSESLPSVAHPAFAGGEVGQGSAYDGPMPPPLTEPPRMPPGEIPPVSKTRPPTPEPLPQPLGGTEPPAVTSEQPPASAPPPSPSSQPPPLEGRQTTGDGDDPTLRPAPLSSGPQPKPERYHPSGPLPPEHGPTPQEGAHPAPGRYHPFGPLPPERDPAVQEPPCPSEPVAQATRLTTDYGRLTTDHESPDATPALRFISQVASHLERQVRNGVSRAALRLYPEALGRVDVHLRLDSTGLHLWLNAETPEAGALFEHHLDQLRDALAARGVNVQELSVSVSTGFHLSANTHSGQQAPPGAESLPTPVPPARHSPAEMASSAPPAPSGEGAQERPLVDYRV